jgi:hypothetical protein
MLPSRLFPVLVLALFLSVPGSTLAAKASPGEIELTPLIGHASPLGDISNGLDGGLFLGLQGLYYATPWLGVGLALNHNRFDGNRSGARLGVTEILAVGKALVPGDGKITPYGKLITGMLIDAVSGENVGGIGGEVAFGLGGGAGVQARLGKHWGLLGEATLMLHLGADVFSYVGLRVGANIHFGGGN